MVQDDDLTNGPLRAHLPEGRRNIENDFAVRRVFRIEPNHLVEPIRGLGDRRRQRPFSLWEVVLLDALKEATRGRIEVVPKPEGQVGPVGWAHGW